MIGTASGRNAEFISDLGADEFVDYTRQPFEEAVNEVDTVFDTVGGDTCERASVPNSEKGGFLVSAVGTPSEEKARESGVEAAWVYPQPSGKQLAEINRLVEEGRPINRLPSSLV